MAAPEEKSPEKKPKSSGEKEAESHEKITEKKENGEIAKTEVMPEAPPKPKVDLKKEG